MKTGAYRVRGRQHKGGVRLAQSLACLLAGWLASKLAASGAASLWIRTLTLAYGGPLLTGFIQPPTQSPRGLLFSAKRTVCVRFWGGVGGRVVNHPQRAECVIGASGTATAHRLDALCALKTPAVWLPAHQPLLSSLLSPPLSIPLPPSSLPLSPLQLLGPAMFGTESSCEYQCYFPAACVCVCVCLCVCLCAGMCVLII